MTILGIAGRFGGLLILARTGMDNMMPILIGRRQVCNILWFVDVSSRRKDCGYIVFT